MPHQLALFQITPLWSLVFGASFAIWVVFEFWIYSRDRKGASGKEKDGGSFFGVVASLWISNGIAFIAPYAVPGARIALPAEPVFWAAIILMWAGMLFRLWAVQTLGRFFRTSVFILDGHRLVTAGPYRVLRHPSYSGLLLTIAGIGLAMGNWVSLAGAVLSIIIGYGWRIVVEEKALRDEFGVAFDDHRRRTWALIPLLW